MAVWISSRSSTICFCVTGYYVLGIQETSRLIIHGFRILSPFPNPGADNPAIRPPISQESQCTYNVVNKARSYRPVAIEKQWGLHSLNVCTCSLRYPACYAHAPYWHVACTVLQHFATLVHKWHDFRKKKLLDTKCLFRFSPQTLSETFLILRKKWSKLYINLIVEYKSFLSDFNETLIFLTDFR
jgi:hypothetical protein